MGLVASEVVVPRMMPASAPSAYRAISDYMVAR